MATLLDEDWSGGANGVAVTTTTTEFDLITSGSATVVHSTEQTHVDSRSCKISGSDSRAWERNLASHVNAFGSFYVYVPASGPPSNFVMLSQMNGAGSAIAWQLRLMTDKTMQYRDNVTARGTAIAMATGWHRVDVSAAGAGNMDVRAYTGANIGSSVTANAHGSILAQALAATNFGKFMGGYITTPGGALTMYFGRTRISDSALPTPLVVPTPPTGGNLQWKRKTATGLVTVGWREKV